MVVGRRGLKTVRARMRMSRPRARRTAVTERQMHLRLLLRRDWGGLGDPMSFLEEASGVASTSIASDWDLG